MKRLSILLMILFLSACGNGETESSEAGNNEEGTETGKVEKWSDEEIAEFEWEKRQSCERLEGKDNERALKICEEIEERETAAGTESNSDEEENQETDENTENDETGSTDGQTGDEESFEDAGTDSGNAEEEPDGEQDTKTEESTKNSTAEETIVQKFTVEEHQKMNQLFYDWAVERAEIGNMAVTKIFFSHGAGGSGDWYANTPDGEVQAQNLNNPGFEHFDIHAIGGVAFYHPISEDFGIDEYAHVPGVGEGYSRLAKPDTNIHKYMLADNGVVYELIAKRENTALTSGFGEYADNGTRGDFTPNVDFEVSQDQDAQQEWQRILGMYQG